MDEVEAKVLEIDEQAVSERLEAVGAAKVFDGEVESRFYDYPDGRIEQQGVLRLREAGDHAFITYKKDISRDGAKTMEEIEFDVSSTEMADRFLQELGLEQVRSSSKHRQKWERDEVEYVIDTYPEVPPLLEIEAPDEETMYQAFDELGYGKEDLKSWDAEQVHDHYES